MEKRRDDKRTVLQKGEYQRSNGSYCYRYKGEDGKQHNIYAPTLRLLREKEKNIQKALMNREQPTVVSKRLNDVFDEWKATKSEMVRSSTFANYIHLYGLYVRPGIGKKKLSELRKDDIVRFYSRLKSENGCSINTVDHVHTVLHGILVFAVDQHYIPYNPADRCMVDLKKTARNIQIKDIDEDDAGELDGTALTKEQQEVLLNFLRSHKTYNHWYPLMAGMLLFGPRLGEMSALQWSDINWERNTIRINKTVVYLKSPATGKMVFEMHPPKTEAGLRWVVMTKPLREIFEKEYLIRKERGSYKAKVGIYEDFIFSSRFEGPMHQGNINKAIRRIVRDCNLEQMKKGSDVLIPPFSSHSFRRTFATRMVEIGLSVKALQDILGHNDASTTLNFYAKVQRELKERQTELIDEKYSSMFATEVLHEE